MAWSILVSQRQMPDGTWGEVQVSREPGHWVKDNRSWDQVLTSLRDWSGLQVTVQTFERDGVLHRMAKAW